MDICCKHSTNHRIIQIHSGLRYHTWNRISNPMFINCLLRYSFRAKTSRSIRSSAISSCIDWDICYYNDVYSSPTWNILADIKHGSIYFTSNKVYKFSSHNLRNLYLDYLQNSNLLHPILSQKAINPSSCSNSFI